MPIFEAAMSVVHHEIWTVEAKDKDEARAKIMAISNDVIEDDTGGEVVDWEITSIRSLKD